MIECDRLHFIQAYLPFKVAVDPLGMKSIYELYCLNLIEEILYSIDVDTVSVCSWYEPSETDVDSRAG